MKLAVNYTPQLAGLLQQGRVQIDSFKCPAWPDLVAAARAVHTTYVHLPLKVGLGIGDAWDTEKHQRIDWSRIEYFLRESDTTLVNLHLNARTTDYPAIPRDSTDPAHIEQLTANLLDDTQAVVARFGAERVIVENDWDSFGRNMRIMYLPEVINRVVAETGCGLLLDLAHAQLAARDLGLDARAYTASLPVARTREIHVNGIHRFDPAWAARLQAAGIAEAQYRHFEGQLVEHLWMGDSDWAFLEWALDQIRAGAWGTPWVVAFEYSGVGGLWEAVTDENVLAEQVPRLYAMIHNDAA